MERKGLCPAAVQSGASLELLVTLVAGVLVLGGAAGDEQVPFGADLAGDRGHRPQPQLEPDAQCGGSFAV